MPDRMKHYVSKSMKIGSAAKHRLASESRDRHCTTYIQGLLTQRSTSPHKWPFIAAKELSKASAAPFDKKYVSTFLTSNHRSPRVLSILLKRSSKCDNAFVSSSNWRCNDKTSPTVNACSSMKLH